MSKVDDLEDVIKNERARGRKHAQIDHAQLRKERAVINDFRRALIECDNETELKKIILSAGLQEGTDRYHQAIDAWREMKRELSSYKPFRR